MSTKILGFLFLLTLGFSGLGAQNFLENNFQKAGREYEAQAEQAMDEGEYLKAGELAELAQIEYRKSREYADSQLLRFRAANAITLAQRAIEGLENTQRAKIFSQDLLKAKAMLVEARSLFALENYPDSRTKALAIVDFINEVRSRDLPEQAKTIDPKPQPATVVLPRFYRVVGRASNTDSFWNIANMPEVYGNNYQWPKLYEANKDKLRNPENPDLIHPDMIFEIPPLRNEIREGMYEPGKVYPKLPE